MDKKNNKNPFVSRRTIVQNKIDKTIKIGIL
jgi:hypothetical protein